MGKVRGVERARKRAKTDRGGCVVFLVLIFFSGSLKFGNADVELSNGFHAGGASREKCH